MPTRLSFRVYGLGLFAMVFAVNAPAPLFESFRRTLNLGPDELALLYSVYSLVIISTLPISGKLSDWFGRRASVLVGLALAAAGCAVLGACDSLEWLLVGRLLQGLAVAAMSAPTAAALAELAPSGPAAGALAATLAMAFGGALGPLLAGVMAETGMVSPMAFAAALAVLAMLGVAVVAEPPRTPRASPATPPTPRVQRGAAFWQSCAAVILAFGVQSTFFTISGPRFASLMTSHALLSAGVAMAVFMSASGAGMLAARRLSAASAIGWGVALLPIGICGFFSLVAAAPFAAVLASVLLAGAGHGLAYVGALRRINATAPAAGRGAYTSQFYVAIYVGGGGPVLAMGALARQVGLTAASTAFGLACAATAAALLVSLWRTSVPGAKPGQGQPGGCSGRRVEGG